MKSASMIALAFVASSAFAAPVSSTISAFNLHQLPVEAVSNLTSASGENLKDFLLNDVRPALRSFTDRTDFEGCGEVAFNATTKQYSVMLFSNKSHLACVTDPNKVEAGFTALNVTIHSHGHEAPFTMNRSDRVFTGMQMDNRPLMIGGENNEHFSGTDFAGGAGFLATPTTVRFQSGSAESECDVKTATCASKF